LSGDAKVFLQESFALTYPDCGNDWIDEEKPISPAAYNRTVIDAEEAAHRFTKAGGRGVILRFAGFYGPDAWPLSDLIRWVRKGWAPVPGAPEAYFSSVSHDDAAAAVLAALDARAGVYNVVDDEPVTRRAYVDSLASVLGVPPPRLPPPWLAAVMGDVVRALTRSLRNWAPRLRSIREGWPEVVKALGER
jgi:2-alkyl-3-oxoalkanoate reductase